MSITIRVKRNGPYLIDAEQAGNVVVTDVDGNALVPEPGRRIALCRCGGSAKKPICDGTHKCNGFAADSSVTTETRTV